MSGSISCPHCGHVLFAIEIAPSVQARDVNLPEAPLLLRVGEAAQTLNVSRSAMYQLVASGQVPVVRIGLSVRAVRASSPRRSFIWGHSGCISCLNGDDGLGRSSGA
jgi:excisionase family DNA binding protein